MKFILISLSSLFFLASTAFAKPIYKGGFFGTAAIKGYDTVAYFKVNKAVKGSKKFSHEWSGATWLFSSQANLDAFKASPTKYAPQYGGFCAYGMAKNSEVGIAPDAFEIVDGKLYLNYNASIQRQWSDSKASYIQQADAVWAKKK